MGTASISILIITGIFVLILACVVIFQYVKKNSMEKTTLTRGFIGNAGDSLNLSCPASRSINLQNAVVMCIPNSGNYVQNDPNDPMFSNGNFNSSTVLDVISEDYMSGANGKTSTTVDLPSSWDGVCQTGYTPVIVGTYDCVPSGTASTVATSSDMISSSNPCSQ